MRTVPVGLVAAIALACSAGEPTTDEVCAECRIALTEEIVIGYGAQEYAPTPASNVIAIGESFFVAPVAAPGYSAVFDRHGQFVKALGRSWARTWRVAGGRRYLPRRSRYDRRLRSATSNALLPAE
jgi:hypothetical protein